jgi:hypothetical protein
MKSLLILLSLKIVSFVGATLNTVGFLTFFFWASLAPYRWHMIVGGMVLIGVSELLTRLLVKKSVEAGGEGEPVDSKAGDGE